MNRNVRSSKNSSSARAELIERLFFSGHVFEKLVFMGTFGLLCFLSGFGVAKKMIDPSRSFVEAPEQAVRQRKQANEEQNKVVGQSKDAEFYFSIRIGSFSNETEAKDTAQAFQDECDNTDFKFSSIHQRYLVYCGHFDDIYSANSAVKKLNTPEHLIVRRSAVNAD